MKPGGPAVGSSGLKNQAIQLVGDHLDLDNLTTDRRHIAVSYSYHRVCFAPFDDYQRVWWGKRQ
jgi:hypothetical protein